MAEINKTYLTIGLFVILASVGTTYLISHSDSAYYCQSRNIVGICESLSKVNAEGIQTRCYYNNTYKTCSSGWKIYNNEDVTGEVTDEEEINVLPDIKDTFDRNDFTEYNFSGVSCTNVSCDDVILINRKIGFGYKCLIEGNEETPLIELQTQLDECEKKQLGKYYDKLIKKEKKAIENSYPKTVMIKGGKRIIISEIDTRV